MATFVFFFLLLWVPSMGFAAEATATERTPPPKFEGIQWWQDGQARFRSLGPGYDVVLTKTDAVLVLSEPRAAGAGGAAVLRMRLVDADPNSEARGLGKLPGKVNYLVGNDRTRWRTNVPTYAQVEYRHVYPGTPSRPR